MKKRTMTLFALLALVTITSYAVSGTYAKYTYNFDTSDSARVAKWGVNKTISIDLFNDSYIAKDADANETDVASKDGENVVAPGTEGFYAFELDLTNTGVPETNYIIKFANITADKTVGSETIKATQDNIKVGGKAKMTYYLKQVTTPLADNATFKDVGFTEADGTTLAAGVETTDDINELVTFIQNKYNNNVYAANAVDDSKWVIGWKWDFTEGDSEDLTDTPSGNATDLATVVLSLNITIEQTELKAVTNRS